MSDEEHIEDPLVEVSQRIEDTQTLYEDLAQLGTPQMTCPECGGRGTQNFGSLGAAECFRCAGARTVALPGAKPFEMPDFGMLRARLKGKDPPSLAEVNTLYDDGVAIARKRLPQIEPSADRKLLSGEDDSV